MIRRGSLSARLIAYWAVGSAIAFFTLPATVYLPLVALHLDEAPDARLEAWTTKRARIAVEASLRKAPDGSKFVELPDEFRAYLKRNPEFRFAVIDTESGAVLPGSSSELAAAFKPLDHVDVLSITFHLTNDPNPNLRGFVRKLDTAVGNVEFIVYGAYFHWDDILYQIYNYFTFTNFVAYAPLFGVIAVVVLVGVRHGLAPLRSAADKIAAIDVNSLNQPLSTADQPTEIAPFVEAVNTALARVDEGVARQRRFLANAAHELRTPITILSAHIANSDETTFRQDVKRDARRIRTIVEQLLSVAHVANQRGAAETDTDLGTTALSVILDYLPLAIECGRNIELDRPDSPIIVRADPWVLESVITNLIENAVRAEPQGGTVLVRVLPCATIEVIDHGSGVAREDQEAIFEPFWRKNDATPGTGLGLAIAKELIGKVGGRIWVEETPSGGATFNISLPRASGQKSEKGGIVESRMLRN